MVDDVGTVDVQMMLHGTDSDSPADNWKRPLQIEILRGAFGQSVQLTAVGQYRNYHRRARDPSVRISMTNDKYLLFLTDSNQF